MKLFEIYKDGYDVKIPIFMFKSSYNEKCVVFYYAFYANECGHTKKNYSQYYEAENDFRSVDIDNKAILSDGYKVMLFDEVFK